MSHPLAHIRGVIFDMNYTLLEWREPMRHAEALARAIRRPVEDVKRSMKALAADYEVGLDSHSRMVQLLTDLGVAPVDQLIPVLTRLEAQECLRPIMVCPRAHWLLANLSGRGLRTAICSNANPIGQFIASATGLTSLVNATVFSCDIGVRKPEAPMYAAATEQLGLTPDQCLYIGDGGDRELWGAKQFDPRMLTVRVDHPEVRAQRDPSDPFLASNYTVPAVADIAGLLPPPN